MSKSLSTTLIYSVSIGLTVWVASIHAAVANPNLATQPVITTPTALQVTDSLASVAGTEATSEQINQAAEASEIKPGDWAYQTLQGLGTKYGCAGTPTGNQTLSREEFATSLNGCIQSMEQLVARKTPKRKTPKKRVTPRAVVEPVPQTPEIAPPAPAPVEQAPIQPPAPPVPEVSQRDINELKQLIQAFNTDLQAVDGRVRTLDAKVAAIKDQSFSTTTKLVGEAIFAVTGLAGGNETGPDAVTRSTIFSNRVRLNFRSSFTGKDLLLVRLQSRNSESFSFAPPGGVSAARTNMARLGFEGNDNNNTTLHRLQYQLPLAATTKVFIESVGSELNDNYYTFNPEHQAAGTGSITRFGRFNPVYRLNNEGAGIGIDHKFSPNLGLVVSYGVPRVGANETVNQPTNNNGLFNGSNTLFSQITLKPADDFSLGLIYARSYHSAGTGVSGNNGSTLANNPFGGTTRTSANHYSLATSINLSKDLIFSAWGGLTQANREAAGGGTAEIWNYAATLAAKDFGSKGSTLGFVVGMQPKVTSRSVAGVGVPLPTTGDDSGTNLHAEVFYKYKLSDNLFITPGLLILSNPENNAGKATEYLGTVRTTFNF